MIRTLLVAVLAPLVFALSACDDLGKCTDPLNGRVPVDANGRVMYAGQAIMQSACASCHGSNATGASRAGAPKGLDFDVLPLDATGTMTVNGELVGTTTDAKGMSGLRSRQRKIFDLRELIWDQVVDGLMPPSGLGDPYKKVSPGAKVTAFGTECTKDTPYAGVTSKATQKVLKQWLACGAPVVEMNVPDLPKPVGGTVGDQYPSCGGPPMDATYENVYMAVITNGGCAVQFCHSGDGAANGLNLDMDVAYERMVGADMMGGTTMCMGYKMVVPGMPEQSYLLTKLGGTTDLTNCSGTIMPPAGKLPQATLDLLEAWIMAGAPGPM